MTTLQRIQPGIYTALWLMPVVALLQASLVTHLQLRGVLPSIALIVVVGWGILRGVDEGVLWAFVGGLCLDVFSDWPFGISTVALVVVASAVSLGGGTFIRTHALLPPATVFMASVLYYVVAMFLLQSTHHPVAWLDSLQSVVLPIALYNAALSLLMFPMLRRLAQKLYPVSRANW
jgi:rod shape-determining protein MreD